jgi:uncharacterized membrane protein SirB2
MDYTTLKALHIASALLSIAGFAARGALMLAGSALLNARLVRIAPHVVDTVLLGSAVALAGMSGQYPFQQGWLTAKVLALFAYIVVGSIALKRGRTYGARAGAFGLALALALYIVSVALLRDAAGAFAYLR